MGNVVIDVSMSMDGYIAAPRIGLMGANIDLQFLAAGLVDERIHLIDVLLGGAVGCSTSSRSDSSWNKPGSASPTA